jgi:hypothetical protein
VSNPVLKLIVLLDQLRVWLHWLLCVFTGFFESIIELLPHAEEVLELAFIGNNIALGLLDGSILECLLLLLGKQRGVLLDELSDLRNKLRAVDEHLIVVVEALYLDLALRNLVLSNPQNQWDSVVESVLNLLCSLGVV